MAAIDSRLLAMAGNKVLQSLQVLLHAAGHDGIVVDTGDDNKTLILGSNGFIKRFTFIDRHYLVIFTVHD